MIDVDGNTDTEGWSEGDKEGLTEAEGDKEDSLPDALFLDASKPPPPEKKGLFGLF